MPISKYLLQLPKQYLYKVLSQVHEVPIYLFHKRGSSSSHNGDLGKGVEVQVISFSLDVVARAKIRLVFSYTTLFQMRGRDSPILAAYIHTQQQHTYDDEGNMHVICYWEYTTLCGHLLFRPLPSPDGTDAQW